MGRAAYLRRFWPARIELASRQVVVDGLAAASLAEASLTDTDCT
jgi:hypothetical protein